MIQNAPAQPASEQATAYRDPESFEKQTIWGLTPAGLHDRFWASRGVQVLRVGHKVELAADAELFLLTDDESLVTFPINQLVDTLSWLRPRVLLLRLHDHRDHGYRERVIADSQDRFVRFERLYGGTDCRLTRVALTSDRHAALAWQQADSAHEGWRRLRHGISQNQRATASINGGIYYPEYESDLRLFTRELVQLWRRPDVTIPLASRLVPNVWSDGSVAYDGGTKFIGPVWVGAGRKLDAIDSVVGPAILWDDPDTGADAGEIPWTDIEATESLFEAEARPVRLTTLQRGGKRMFDIVFALAALAITLPFYPLIMLAIWIEDRSPFFFAHRRETLGGHEFPCIKFRTMRRDAEDMKVELAAKNQSDGPQFFIDDDPRITRVGKFMRRYNIDELPQFFNVLVGQMSIVGPRPSPYKENQYCPSWRETRLSVRPGITGLWQVRRSRQEGLDFQEWIRYDIQYVEKANWKLDLWIIWQTIKKLAGRG